MLIISNPTSLLSRDERLSAAVRWTGRTPDGTDIPFGLWLPSQIFCASNQQVACADLVREWAHSLRENPRMARRCEELGIEDGWWMLSYFLSYREQLQVELVVDGDVVT